MMVVEEQALCPDVAQRSVERVAGSQMDRHPEPKGSAQSVRQLYARDVRPRPLGDFRFKLQAVN
ncbi:hypothetical protein D9M72_549650 [compost metagenome]